MERRIDDRIAGWAQVRIRHEGTDYHGVALNLSSTGLYIEAGEAFTKGDQLVLSLHLPDTVDPQLNVEVSWVSKVGSHIPGLNFRIGLKIQEMESVQEEIFSKFYRQYGKQSFESSRLARIQVVVHEHQEMHGLRPFTLFQGGCFLLIDRGMPELGQELTVSFHIPTSPEPVTFLARVVYLVDNDHAASLGIEKGIGLQFIEILHGSQRSLVAFLGKSEPVFES